MVDTIVPKKSASATTAPMTENTADALLFAAFLHLNFGRLAECETLLRFALRTEADDPRFLKLAAHVFIERQHPREALELLEKLEKIVGEKPEMTVDVIAGSPIDILFARAYLAVDDLDTARGRFKKHLERLSAGENE